MSFLKFLFSSLWILLVGCTSLSFWNPNKYKSKVSTAPKKASKILKELKAKPPLPSTLKELTRFIDENQENKLAIEASIYLGKVLKNKNKKKKACNIYKKATQFPSAHAKERAVFFLYSNCLFQKKKVKAALNLLETQIELASPSVKKKLTEKQWKFVKNKKLPYWKLVVLNRLSQYSSPTETESWIKKGETIIQNVTEEQFAMLEKKRASLGLFEGELLFQAGKKKWTESNFKKANLYFKEAQKNFPLLAEDQKKSQTT